MVGQASNNFHWVLHVHAKKGRGVRIKVGIGYVINGGPKAKYVLVFHSFFY